MSQAVCTSAFPKRCACGRSFARVEWEELPICGIYADEYGPRLDMRNCPCRSTIAVELPDHVSVCVACGTWIDECLSTHQKKGTP